MIKRHNILKRVINLHVHTKESFTVTKLKPWIYNTVRVDSAASDSSHSYRQVVASWSGQNKENTEYSCQTFF